MEQAAKLARLGDRLVSLLAGGLILLMLLYGGYSLWDTAMVYSGAFLSEDGQICQVESGSAVAGVDWLANMMESGVIGWARSREEALEHFNPVVEEAKTPLRSRLLELNE